MKSVSTEKLLQTLESRGELEPCGHLSRARVRGCGGCDPGAVSLLIEEDGSVLRAPRVVVTRDVDDSCWLVAVEENGSTGPVRVVGSSS